MKPCRNILAALLGILLSGCGEVVTGNYATYQDAVSDDLFRRGWLPDILPQTTINIRTTNNLDINTSSGSFEMPKSDISMFKSRLSKMPDGKYAYSYGEISKDPTWVFAIGDDKGNVTYVFSSD
jgi:hypothetical protein